MTSKGNTEFLCFSKIVIKYYLALDVFHSDVITAHLQKLEKLSYIVLTILIIQSTPVNSYPDNSDLRLIRTSLRPPIQDDQSKIILLIRISRYS